MVKKINYYKYATYFLILLILLGGILYSHITIKNDVYEKGIQFGQENTVNIILTEISENGQMTIQTEGGNITLLPLSIHEQQLLSYTQNIIDTANTQGYITLRTTTDQVTLLRLDPTVAQE